MMMRTTMDWQQRLLLAGAAALLGPAALSAEVTPAGEVEVMTVTAPRVVCEVRPTKIEFDLDGLIDAIDKRIADDQQHDLEAIGTRRIELAMVEVPPRG